MMVNGMNWINKKCLMMEGVLNQLSWKNNAIKSLIMVINDRYSNNA